MTTNWFHGSGSRKNHHKKWIPPGLFCVWCFDEMPLRGCLLARSQWNRVKAFRLNGSILLDYRSWVPEREECRTCHRTIHHHGQGVSWWWDSPTRERRHRKKDNTDGQVLGRVGLNKVEDGQVDLGLSQAPTQSTMSNPTSIASSTFTANCRTSMSFPSWNGINYAD